MFKMILQRVIIWLCLVVLLGYAFSDMVSLYLLIGGLIHLVKLISDECHNVYVGQ